MSKPEFGVQFNRNSDEPLPIIQDEFSRFLVVDESEDASDVEFAVDTVKRFGSSDKDAVEALGTGPLRDHVRGIQDQLDGLNASADIIAVRVGKGANDAATAANIVNIIDDVGSIPSAANATPRIVIAGQTDFRPDDPDNAGQKLKSPVIASLETKLGNILAVAPVSANPGSMEDAIEDRETMNSDRILPVGVACKVQEGDQIVTRSMISRVGGLFARVDKENDSKPFDPIANRPIKGIVGLSRDIPFSMLTGAIEGQMMLAANVSIAVQGETGVDGAIDDGGYIYIGTDTATSNPLDEQIHQVRGTDYLTVKMMRNARQHLGRKKVTASMVEAWLLANWRMLRDHAKDDDILGYTPLAEMFLRASNSLDEIRLGTLTTDVGIEPAPVFKLANHNVRRYRPALQGLLNDIMASLQQAA